MHEYNHLGAWPIMTVPGSNLLISFSYAWVLVNQKNFFQYTYTHNQHGFESSLEIEHTFMLLWFLFGNGRGHDLTYFVNVQSKSKVLGHLTAQHVILISTSGHSIYWRHVQAIILPWSQAPPQLFVAYCTKAGEEPGNEAMALVRR